MSDDQDTRGLAGTAVRVDYATYIVSDEWRARRAAALSRCGRRCQLCSATRGLEVHHNSYEHLGDERPEDLVVLCKRCHEVFHVRRDKRTATKMLRRDPSLSALPKRVDALPQSPPPARAALAVLAVPPADDAATVLVTDELLGSLMTGNGGFMASTLAMFGIPWPPSRGWRSRIEGREMSISAGRLAAELKKVAERNASLATPPGGFIPNREEIAQAYRKQWFQHADTVAERFRVSVQSVKRIAREVYGDLAKARLALAEAERTGAGRMNPSRRTQCET